MYELKSKKYDTLIIGGGHNGLIAGTYLAKKGKKVKIARHTVATKTETENEHLREKGKDKGKGKGKKGKEKGHRCESGKGKHNVVAVEVQKSI